MTDLISYAMNSMTRTGTSEGVPQHNPAKAAAYLAACDEAKDLTSSQRCNVWRRFIKEHGGIDDLELASKVCSIPDERRLVGKDEERSELHPHARTFPSLTVSNVLKYMP